MAFQAFENLKLTLARRLNPVGQGVRLAETPMKKTLKYGGPLLGGLALYFYGLGKAAFTGFLIGASIGGTIGAGVGGYIGLQVALATGPFAPIVGIVTVPLGAAAGGVIGASIGGIAGGLIGLGMAAGSTTLASMGVGTGIGGLIGGYIGFTAGAAVGTALAAACIAVSAFICTPLAPFIVAGSTFTGTAIGATLGALVGSAAGYAFGKYVATPLTNAFKGAVSKVQGGAPGAPTGAGIPSSVTSGLSKAASGLSNIVSGAVSSAWNGFTGLLGGAANLLGNFGSFITGLTSAEAAPLGAALAPVATATATVTAGTIIVSSIILPAAFFTAEGEGAISPIPGQNQYFTLTKTATPANVVNQGVGGSQQVLFTITLNAKDTILNNVQVLDEARGGAGGSILITTDSSGNPISPVSCPATMNPGEICTRQITLSIDSRFNDSIVTNTARVIATPQGQSVQTTAVVATVRVGSPSTQCPRGWPNTGTVTQGPEGTSSHGPLGLEAIDIGTPIGTSIYATVQGTVIFIDETRGAQNKLIDVQPTNCSGLNVVRYQHLSAVNVTVGQTITNGQIIGASGNAGSGPHHHYQFNRTNERNFRMEPPNIPQAVPRVCDGNCNVTINTAP